MENLKIVMEKWLFDCGNKTHRYDEIEKNIKSVLNKLAINGDIILGKDKDLTGDSLEIRTQLIFEHMGFIIKKGRSDLEDFVVEPPSDFQPKIPLVVEVKSSKKQNIGRDNLRQLDDWVFDLSGESKIRKEGLAKKVGMVPSVDPTALATGGLFRSETKHPSPHKGVMIFNGPLGIDFNKRKDSCIDQNEEFVKKRNFCIILFAVLVSYMENYEQNKIAKKHFWSSIHNTSNILGMPKSCCAS